MAASSADNYTVVRPDADGL